MSDTAPEAIQLGIEEPQFHPGISKLGVGWPVVVLILGGVLNAAWVGFLAWALARVVGLL